MADLITIYCTFPSLEYAEKVAQHLLTKRLVACANILPGEGRSMYTWKGEFRSEPEIYAYFKTTKDKYDAARDAIKSLHPYVVPCIVAWDIPHVNADYHDWVVAETT